MKCGLLLAAIALWPHAVPAQELAAPESVAQEAPGGPAFQINIEAPDAVRILLQKHLELERFRALTDLTDSELSRLVLDAPKNIHDLVATLGYFSPKVEVAMRPRSAAAPLPTVAIQVDPGEPTRVALVEITLSGTESASPEALARRDEIADQWTLMSGMHFTQTDWTSAKQKALRQLIANRFPNGRIASSQIDIDPEKNTANVQLALETGVIYRTGALVITGTKHYGTELVERLARLPPGDEYDQARLIQAQQRLLDSGYFDSAQVTLDVTGDPGAAPVHIHVVEAPLQKLVLGIGASTDSGARLSATHTHHLVPGIGWRAVSKLALDRDTRSIVSELTSQPDASSWQWAGSAQVQTQRLGSFDVTSHRLRTGRTQGGVLTDQNYYLQYDRAQAAASDLLETVVVQSLSFNYAYTLRHFDSVPFPSSGWGLGLELGGGSTFGATQDPYARVMARAQAYLPLARHGASAHDAIASGRLAFRTQLGAVVAREDASIPSTQLFVTGGDTSVRGFSRGEIGLDLPGTLVTAGRYLAVASAEWQRPIMQNGLATDWESALFIDSGAVANTPPELNPRFGIGAGVRWKSPVGPLQLDLAYGAPRGHLHLHMNLGFTF